MRRCEIGELSWRRLFHSVMLIVLTVYGIVGICGGFFADLLIFYPQPPTYSDGNPYQKLPTPEGDILTIRYLRHPHASHTILYSHGNAEDLGDIASILEAFYAHGFSVMAYDYSGYGTSAGSPSEQAAYANILAVYHYLCHQQHLDPERLIVFGRSVGGGPSVELAYRQPVGGLVLESVFTSVFRILTKIPIFPFDKFDNLSKITAIRCPILVIHGKQDEVVPFWHGAALYKKANFPKMHLWVETADHNDTLWVAGEKYWTTLSKFKESIEAHRASTEVNM